MEQGKLIPYSFLLLILYLSIHFGSKHIDYSAMDWVRWQMNRFADSLEHKKG
jgi:hypothetical protein